MNQLHESQRARSLVVNIVGGIAHPNGDSTTIIIILIQHETLLICYF